MTKFLISYHTGDEISGRTDYYRIEYSSKEKLIDDFNKAGQEAIDAKSYSFLFLNRRFFLQDFDYGYYDEGYDEFEKEKFNIASRIMTLDEWFFERDVLKEGTPNIDPSNVSIQNVRNLKKISENEAPFGKFTLCLPNKEEIIIFHSNKESLMESLFYNAKKAKSQGQTDFEFFGVKINVNNIVDENNEKTSYEVKVRIDNVVN